MEIINYVFFPAVRGRGATDGRDRTKATVIDKYNPSNHAVNIGTEYLPDLYGNNFSRVAIELDNLMIELGAAGSDTWIDFMNDVNHDRMKYPLN